mgnify:CR=1 FL=1
MKPIDVQAIVDVLKMLQELESAIAEFYTTCAQHFEENKNFWLRMAAQETGHSQNLSKMAEIILKDYQHFERSRVFNPAALKTIISGIIDAIQKVRSGKIPKSNILFIARDIEKSLVEARYSEIVQSSNVEYQNFLKEILSQTHDHQRLIDGQIENMKRR